MSVLDCSIKLGKLLRKTEEGQELFQIKNNIEEKYEGKEEFNIYKQFAERQSNINYFYSWSIAYNTFLNVLKDSPAESRKLFLPTAELVSSDEDIEKLSLKSISFGDMFEKLVGVIISGGKYEEIISAYWKYKVKNAVSDVQIAVERTLLTRSITLFYQKHQNSLDNAMTKKYLSEREKNKLLPFSEDALKMMSDEKNLSEEEKLLYERMYLIIEAVKMGIYYGFWGIVTEVDKSEIDVKDVSFDFPLKEISISFKNVMLPSEGWLYKIQLEDKCFFFMAHKKEIRCEQDYVNTTLSGIVYPPDDRRIFEKSGND